MVPDLDFTMMVILNSATFLWKFAKILTVYYYYEYSSLKSRIMSIVQGGAGKYPDMQTMTEQECIYASQEYIWKFISLSFKQQIN